MASCRWPAQSQEKDCSSKFWQSCHLSRWQSSSFWCKRPCLGLTLSGKDGPNTRRLPRRSCCLAEWLPSWIFDCCQSWISGCPHFMISRLIWWRRWSLPGWSSSNLQSFCHRPVSAVSQESYRARKHLHWLHRLSFGPYHRRWWSLSSMGWFFRCENRHLGSRLLGA